MPYDKKNVPSANAMLLAASLTILAGCNAESFLKGSVEVLYIWIANRICHILYGHISISQKRFCSLQSGKCDMLTKGFSGFFLNVFGNVRF